MLANVFDMLFGCWHHNYSFPISAKKTNINHPHAANLTGTYVVCLDCGKEFPYDWNQMRILSGEPQPVKAAPLSAAAAHLEKVA